MKTILVTGHRGLIGSALCPALAAAGWQVRGLTRSPRAAGEFAWDYRRGVLDPKALENLDAVIHLAGENIAGGRWNAARKRRIYESRAEGTRFLAGQLAALEHPPEVIISMSGVGFYAADGIPKTEADGPGQGFLSEVCVAWERAADPARSAGIRVVHPRLGVVLTPERGALAKMLSAFRLGLGGPIGNGRQTMAWISLDDVVAALIWMLDQGAIEGPVNLVAPEICSQRTFAQALGKTLKRPAIFPLPAVIVRLLFGEMGEATLLSDLPVTADKLALAGFQWRHPTLREALEAFLS